MKLVLMKFAALSGRSALFPTFSCHPSPQSLGDACSDPAASQPWHLPLLRATPCQHPLSWWIPLYLLQSQHLKPMGSEQSPHSPHSCCRRQLTRRDARVHTQKEGKVWAKAKVFWFFFYLFCFKPWDFFKIYSIPHSISRGSWSIFLLQIGSTRCQVGR